MKTEQSTPTWNRPKRKFPEQDEPVIVLCEDCRCLGYLDGHGVWRQATNDAPIKGVIGWSEIGE